MAEIVNLRQARKRKVRAAGQEAASENRARFGRTGVEKARDKAERNRVDRAVDGARLPAQPAGDDETPRSD